MDKIKMALIVSGFPSKNKPSYCLFNKIGAENLSKYADVKVIQFSLWKPGKKIFYSNFEQSYAHYRISIPFPAIYRESVICAQFKLYEKIAIKKMFKELNEIEIIHSVGVHVGSVLGSRLGRNFNKPNVLQLIGSDVNVNLPKMKDYKCFKNIMSWTQAVGCNSLELKKRFIELMGETPMMPVIYNGVDVERFKFVKKINSDSRGLKFLYLGGLPSYKYHSKGRNLKGGLTLLEAWKENEELLNQNECTLVFAGPDSNIQIAKEYKASMKYTDSISLLGYLKHEEVRKYMHKADVVIIPSLEEGMPNVAMEAGAMGKCIIASNVGGLQEIITSYENGILIEPGDVKSLKDALTYILLHKEKLQEYCFRIRKVIEEKFNADNFAPQYIQLYKSILKRK